MAVGEPRAGLQARHKALLCPTAPPPPSLLSPQVEEGHGEGEEGDAQAIEERMGARGGGVGGGGGGMSGPQPQAWALRGPSGALNASLHRPDPRLDHLSRRVRGVPAPPPHGAPVSRAWRGARPLPPARAPAWPPKHMHACLQALHTWPAGPVHQLQAGAQHPSRGAVRQAGELQRPPLACLVVRTLLRSPSHQPPTRPRTTACA